MSTIMPFGPGSLAIDAAAEVAATGDRINRYLARVRRRGAVVAMSGGIDSSVVASLCVAALGKDRVLGLLMPERESSAETLRLSRLMADSLGIQTVMEDISPVLDAVGCYRRRDDAIRLVYPGFGPEHKAKIVLPSVIDTDSFRIFSIVILTPEGREVKTRLTPESYLGIVAATNFKQRVRKMLEYHHADRLNYAVTGTPNRLEYDQGFFVKLGDGAADFKPIAHLYKTQVYQLAAHLRLPAEIQSRPPTTDTYSMPQSQEEFYFSLPYGRMDLCLFGKNNDISLPEVASATGLTEEQVRRVYRDIEQKRATTAYLHLPPQVLSEVPEVQ
jgi:NAD+ synthase